MTKEIIKNAKAKKFKSSSNGQTVTLEKNL